MKTPLVYCVAVLTTVHVGQGYAQTAAPTAPAAAAEQTKAAPVRPEDLTRRVRKENEDAVKRMEAIDKIIEPVMTEEAVKLYGIKPEEFKFLRMQSESQQTSSFLNKQRRMDAGTVEGLVQYFDEAYRALKGGEFWYGREESLVPKDAELYATMKGEVMAAIAKRPDGAKILELIHEREALTSKMKSSMPLFNYLSERREWWKFYPDYKKAVEDDFKHQMDKPGTQ